MGLFRRKKQNIDNNKIKDNQQGEYTVPINSRGDTASVFRFRKENEARHRDNEITDVIMARIIESKDDECIIFDAADYIVFEIPRGSAISNELIGKIVENYEYNKKEYQKELCSYIGRYSNSERGYQYNGKSNTVDRYVKESIIPKIQKEIELKKQLIQQSSRNHIKKDEFKESLNSNVYLNQKEAQRQQRKSNPYLRQIDKYLIGNKEYQNYDGININSGEILRIRKLDKIGKDGNNTYLYSAILDNTENEDDVEFLDTKNLIGNRVCFELQQKIEDIIKQGNQNEINKVLSLLSDGRNFNNKEELKYIGGIDKSGQIQRNSESSSLAIKNTVEQLKKEYKQQAENER